MQYEEALAIARGEALKNNEKWAIVKSSRYTDDYCPVKYGFAYGLRGEVIRKLDPMNYE